MVVRFRTRSRRITEASARVASKAANAQRGLEEESGAEATGRADGIFRGGEEAEGAPEPTGFGGKTASLQQRKPVE